VAGSIGWLLFRRLPYLCPLGGSRLGVSVLEVTV
jgi:hypothetical protein